MTPAQIISASADKHSVPEYLLRVRCHLPHVVRARSEAMVAMRSDLHMSFAEIAKVCSCHHTSVIAAVRRMGVTAKIDVRKKSTRQLTVEVGDIRRELDEIKLMLSDARKILEQISCVVTSDRDRFGQ